MIALWKQAKKRPSATKEQNIVAVFIIFFVFFINSLLSVSHISETYDEIYHYQYGEKLLAGDSARSVDSTMPISMWNALPKALAAPLPDGSLKTFLSGIFPARLMTVFFACGVAFLVFYFARSLYGFLPAVASLGLFVLNPNILAHSQLVTTDIYATGALLLMVFAAWRFTLLRNWKSALFVAISVAFAQVTKFTALLFPFPIFLSLLIYDLILLSGKDTKMWAKELQRLFFQYLGVGALIVVFSILFLNIAYLFQRTFTPFGEYTFRNSLFSGLQEDMPILNDLPVPLPYAHLQGIDWTMEHERTGQWHGNLYLLGEIKEGDGFPGYFIVASFFKEPIAAQALFLFALIFYLSDKAHRKLFWKQELFLFIPVLFYFIYFNFFYNSQIGIRHYLIIFPLVFVFTGSLFSKWTHFSFKHKAILSFAFVYMAVSVLSYFPYYVPYTNETVWDRKDAYLYLADSNLDWGQGQFALNEYLAANPQAQYEPERAAAGLIVVSPNALVGVTEPPQKYAWLRENFQPVDVIAYEYLVYDISSAEFDKICIQDKQCQ